MNCNLKIGRNSITACGKYDCRTTFCCESSLYSKAKYGMSCVNHIYRCCIIYNNKQKYIYKIKYVIRKHILNLNITSCMYTGFHIQLYFK